MGVQKSGPPGRVGQRGFVIVRCARGLATSRIGFQPGPCYGLGRAGRKRIHVVRQVGAKSGFGLKTTQNSLKVSCSARTGLKPAKGIKEVGYEGTGVGNHVSSPLLKRKMDDEHACAIENKEKKKP